MEDKDLLLASATIVASMLGRYQQGLPDKLEESLCEKAFRMALILAKKASEAPRP